MENPFKIHRSVELGKSIVRFRPALSNIVAGWILCCLAIGGAVAGTTHVAREIYRKGGQLPFNADRGLSWLSVMMGLVLLALILGFAWLMAGMAWGLASKEVELFERGFSFREKKRQRKIVWSNVDGIIELTTYERPPLLKYPYVMLIPEVASKSYTITTYGGEEFKFSGNSIPDLKRFAEVLQDRAQAFRIAWSNHEEHTGP